MKNLSLILGCLVAGLLAGSPAFAAEPAHGIALASITAKAREDVSASMQNAIAAKNLPAFKADLLRAGTPNLLLKDGDTPLTYALRLESATVWRDLLSRGDVDVKMRNRFGESPLMLAAFKGNVEAFDALIERGARPDEKSGWTALDYAVMQKRTEMVKRLLALGAEVNARTKNGVTALHLAAKNKDRNLVMTLLRAGAYRDQCTLDGLSPADFARRAGDEELAHYLAIPRCAKPIPLK